MRNRCLSISLVIALFGGVSELVAQRGTGRVAGTIRDTEGNPIEGAKVIAQLSGTEFVLEATTDENGRWAILGFRRGTYSFTYGAEGYQPQIATTSIKQLGKNPAMKVELEKIQEAFARSMAGTLLADALELQEQKEYSEALAKYDEILTESPSLYQIHMNVGNVYRDMGNFTEAIAEYELVLKEEPEHGGALVSIGDVLVKQNKLKEAVELFERAILQVPEDEVLPFNVAEIYFDTGNVDRAIEYYQRASKVKPDWPEPYLKLGYAYLNAADMEAASAAFQKVVELASGTPQAQMAQSALESIKN